MPVPAVAPETHLQQILNRERGLHRTLSAGQLSMIAIGGAIGTGLFLGSGFAIGLAGPAVLVSYAIGGLITLLLMGCLAEMSVAYPASGSFGSWAEVYIGPLAGFLVRFTYWAAIVFAVGTEVTAVAVYMRYWFPAVPGAVWIILFSGALVAINIANVRVFGSVEYGFSALKIGAILLFLILGSWVAARIGFGNYTGHGGFFPKGPSGMWVATIVSIFSYLSIEMIAVAAGEAEDPHRAVVSAFRATVFRLIFFYLCTLALIVAIVPWNTAGTSASPFVTVMAATGIPGAAGAVNFIILIAALSAMNSQLYITARMMFSLSRAGFAPRGLGRIGSRGTPVNALWLSTIGIALAAAINTLYPETAYTIMMAIAIFGGMFTWLMIFITHLFFRRRYTGPPLKFRMWFFPYGTLLGAGLMAALLITTPFTREFRMTLVYGLPFLVILAVCYRFVRNEPVT